MEPRAVVLALLALATALGAGGSYSPASSEDSRKFEALVEFLRSQYRHDPKEHPFHLRVVQGVNQHGVRGLFATEDVAKGGVLVTIPAGAALNVGGDTGDDVESTVRLITELRSPCTRFKEYFKMFPSPREVVNYCNFPDEYVAMLQSPYWAFLINMYRQRLDDMLSGRDSHTAVIMLDEAIGRHNVTIDELRYVCALVTTRVVSMHPRKTTVLLPIFDLANHRKNCSVNLGAWSYLGHWDRDLHLVATRDIQKGEELCYMYGDHRDDHMLVYYGFMPKLPEGQSSDGLFTFDHHKFQFDHEKAETEGPKWPEAHGPDVSGMVGATAEQVASELARLRMLQDSLDLLLDASPNPQPVPGWEGLHRDLLEYQRRRKAAIAEEIKRLESRRVRFAEL